MKIGYSVLILLLLTATAFSNENMRQTEGATRFEVKENKAAQQVYVTLTFLPVTTLDSVTNEEMTLVCSQFLAEEALSSYFKAAKSVDFSKAKFVVHENTQKVCRMTYTIPLKAITKVESKKEVVYVDSVKKYLSSI